MFHIIDDTTFVCDLLTDILRSQGFEARVFHSPDAYIKYISSVDFEEPSGVFTDINMPYMSGYEMMDIVSIIRPNLNFAIMTSDLNIRSGYVDNTDFYLAKPFRLAEVVKVIDALLKLGETPVKPDMAQGMTTHYFPHCA
ncbi:MAG: response regulator [Ghiorsea sp.]